MRRWTTILVFSSVALGCGDESFDTKEHPGDHLLRRWYETDRWGSLWMLTGQEVGEDREPRCEFGAQFVEATRDGEIDRTKVRQYCARYPSLALRDGEGLRPVGAGVVVLGLGAVRRNVTIGASFGLPIELECDVDVGDAAAASMQSAAAEDEEDEVTAFVVEVPRPDPVTIDAPAAVGSPVPVYGDGDLDVLWSGGASAAGVEILLQAVEEDDDGDGILRCWTPDDGVHSIPGSLVDPFRDDRSVLTVSRSHAETTEVGGWTLHARWTDATSMIVFPY